MLVLSRKMGEQICIGSGIQIKVLAIEKGRVRLGLAAPRELPIYRQELCQAVGFASPHGDGAQSSSVMKVG